MMRTAEQRKEIEETLKRINEDREDIRRRNLSGDLSAERADFASDALDAEEEDIISDLEKSTTFDTIINEIEQGIINLKWEKDVLSMVDFKSSHDKIDNINHQLSLLNRISIILGARIV